MLIKNMFFSRVEFYFLKWVALSALLLAIIIIVWVSGDTSLRLHARWIDWGDSYSHGYLLTLVCLYFITHRLSAQLNDARPNVWLSLLGIFPGLLYAFGFATQIGVFQQLALPAMVAALVVPLIGLRKFMFLLYPFLLLYISVPVWEVFLPLLRSMTSEVSTFGVRLVGVPAYIDGFSFTLPYGTVLIAGSCAGLNFFMIGFALASINSLYRRMPLRYALLSIAIMSLFAIFGNWLRVFLLILIAYYSEMQSPLVADHVNFGWMIFTSFFFLYLWVIRNFPETATDKLTTRQPLEIAQLKQIVMSLSLSLLLMLSFPLWFQTIFSQQGNVSPFVAVEDSKLEPITKEQLLGEAMVLYQGFDASRFYKADIEGHDWVLGQLIYASQTQGKELVSTDNSLSNLENIERRKYSVTPALEVELTIVNDRKSRILISVYQIGMQTKTSKLGAKLAQFTESLAGRPLVALWYATRNCDSDRCDQEVTELERNPKIIQQWIESMALYTKL